MLLKERQSEHHIGFGIHLNCFKSFITAIKDIKRTNVFNFIVHTVWFYGQCFANREFLEKVLEYNLKIARDTVF